MIRLPLPVRVRSRSAARISVDGREGAGGEVGDLHRRERGSGVLQQAGPAEVVEVVAGPRVVGAEARERAVDDGLGQVVGADAQALDDSGAEALDHDVGVGAERAACARGRP